MSPAEFAQRVLKVKGFKVLEPAEAKISAWLKDPIYKPTFVLFMTFSSLPSPGPTTTACNRGNHSEISATAL